MGYYNIWREVSKFAPEDWDVRQYRTHVSMECKGENHRAWYMYAHISKISLGAEIEFACVYNHEEVIELIDTCIHSAAKLINTINYIEKEVNN